MALFAKKPGSGKVTCYFCTDNGVSTRILNGRFNSEPKRCKSVSLSAKRSVFTLELNCSISERNVNFLKIKSGIPNSVNSTVISRNSFEAMASAFIAARNHNEGWDRAGVARAVAAQKAAGNARNEREERDGETSMTSMVSDAIEKVTGLDIDGDGQIGALPRPKLFKSGSKTDLSQDKGLQSPNGRQAAATQELRKSSSSSSVQAPWDSAWGPMPSPEEAIYEGQVEVQGVYDKMTWKSRYAMLTKDRLLFSRKDRKSMDADGDGQLSYEEMRRHMADMIDLNDIDLATEHLQILCQSDDHRENAADQEGLSPNTGCGHEKMPPVTLLMPSGCFSKQMERRSFQVPTVQDGFNNGRVYEILCETPEERDKWVCNIHSAVLAHRQRLELQLYNTRWKRMQHSLRTVYEGNAAQMVVALLITSNFVINCIAFELLPEEGTSTGKVFHDLEVAFNYLFLAELIFNLAAHWFVDFFCNGWNVFDFIVVIMSTAAMAFPMLPGLSLLRLVRVVRVVKLFKQLQRCEYTHTHTHAHTHTHTYCKLGE
jgi:hypothetical protein